MRPITIFIAFCLIRKSVQTVEFYEEKATPVNQLACVNTALKTYLENDRNIHIFSASSNSPVNSLLKVPVVVITEWDLMNEVVYGAKGAVMIFLEGNADQDFDCLERLRGIVKLRPVLIACITDIVCSSDMYMKRIVEMEVNVDLRYVAVDENGVIDIYEHTTMAEGLCGMAQLLRRGHCSNKSTAKKVFQESLNFHKCPMRVVSWPYQSYSKFRNHEELNPRRGVEETIVQVVARKINATPTLLITETPDDVRRLVANGDGDLGFGGLDTRLFEGVSYTVSYMVVQATFVAGHSTWAMERSIESILQPLEGEVWIGIGVVVVLIFLLRTLVPSFREIHALQLFGMLIGIPVPRQPRGLPGRIYFLSLVLFSYFCSSSYLTNLTKMLATPQQNMIKTLDDLEHSSIQITGPVDSRKKFRPDYPRIYRDFQVQDFPEYYDGLLELLWTGHSHSAYYVEEMDRRITAWKTVEPINERFNWYSVAFVAPNTSVILRNGGDIFLRIAESGILTIDEVFMPNIYRSAEYDKLPSFGQSAVLKSQELKGVFYLYMGGLGIGFLVLLVEIVTSFIRKKTGLRRRGEIHSERSRRRRVHGIMLSRDTSRMR